MEDGRGHGGRSESDSQRGGHEKYTTLSRADTRPPHFSPTSNRKGYRNVTIIVPASETLKIFLNTAIVGPPNLPLLRPPLPPPRILTPQEKKQKDYGLPPVEVCLRQVLVDVTSTPGESCIPGRIKPRPTSN